MKEIQLDFTTPIKKLEISPLWQPAKGTFASRYASVFKGRGLEFEGFREYDELTDDAKLIDWKASLRANKLLVRELVEERNLEVFFLFDVSESMLFSSIEKLKCEYAAEFIAALSYGILSAEDSVGIGFFNDRLRTWISPGRGVEHFAIIKLLLRNPANYGGKYDLSKSLRDVLALPRMKTLSVLFVVSDFIGARGLWKRYLRIACNRFDTIVVCIRDPIDMELPSVPSGGEVVFEDALSGKRLAVDPGLVGDAYKKENERFIEELGSFVRMNRGDFLFLRTDEDFVKPVLDLFSKRAARFI